MPRAVEFDSVSTVGLESSPVAASLAGLRTHEARYFRNKYDPGFTVEPASQARATIEWVHRILKEERDIGFKLAEGMDVPMELTSRFRFARQKSKLAGTTRGSYLAFQNEY